MLIEGILARKVAMMPLLRVTDMKYTQTPVGRVLGYGTFELESAGQEQALRKIENLPNPTDLYLQVVEEMYEPEASEARRRPATVDDGGI
jgi:membrane protein YdbS with pleckstrin-like domain